MGVQAAKDWDKGSPLTILKVQPALQGNGSDQNVFMWRPRLIPGLNAFENLWLNVKAAADRCSLSKLTELELLRKGEHFYSCVIFLLIHNYDLLFVGLQKQMFTGVDWPYWSTKYLLKTIFLLYQEGQPSFYYMNG